MRLIYILLMAMAVPTIVQAQRFLNEVFPSYSKTANITYANNISVLTGAPVATNLVMDVYQPAGMTDTMSHRPLIILLHSGTFLPPYLNTQLEGGRNDSGLVFLCQSFAKRGYVVANIDYRLGWNPAGSTVDIRKGTLIQAFIRAVQDVKAAVRFFRKDAGTADVYKIDSNAIIVGGEHTGAALAVNYAALLNQSQLSIPKFISNVTNATYGFQAGQPYVNPAIMGDLDGYGGMATFNNPNNSPGYNGKANFIISYEAIIGDSSWVVPGLPPMVSFHRINQVTNQPYLNGLVYVIIGTPQPVVDVSGSGVFIPLTNQKGNNNCFRPNNFTDPYTQKAMALSSGEEGLYPQPYDYAGISWWDSVSSVTECMAYGISHAKCADTIYASYANVNHKAISLLYIDTLMGYVNPRIVKCLNLAPTGIEETTALRNNLHIFPNPSSGNITISAEGSMRGIDKISIRDVTGRTLRVLSLKQAHLANMNLDAIPSGIYLISVFSGTETVTRKIVVE